MLFRTAIKKQSGNTESILYDFLGQEDIGTGGKGLSKKHGQRECGEPQ